MKVLFLSENYYKFKMGGSELQCKYLIDCLKSRFDIYYLFIHEKNIFFQENNIKLIGIEKKPALERFFGKIVYFKDILKVFYKISPHIIYHRNLSNLGLPIISYCKYNQIKSILHLAHEKDVWKFITFDKFILKNTLELFGKKILLKNFDFIIAQTNYQDKLLQKNFFRKANIIFPNAHPFPNNQIKKKINVVVLWVANFKPWKQPEKFIQLAKECEDTDAEFIMIGRSPENRWAHKLKNEIKKVKNLKYLGELPIDKINNLLSYSHILVNTSKSEGFPNTFIQAWMRKVPVVSLHCDPDDLIKKNKIGFYSGNMKNLILNVKKLIQDKKLREQIGKRAQNYALQFHSLKAFNKIINLMEECYNHNK